jgi:hypothetical protein
VLRQKLAGEGAFVFLAGRTKSLESVEAQIRESGGLAQSGFVDALDERSVEDNLSKWTIYQSWSETAIG